MNLPGNAGNGVLFARGAMPFKPDTVSDESGFARARRVAVRTDGDGGGDGTKRWFNRSNRGAGARLQRLRVDAAAPEVRGGGLEGLRFKSGDGGGGGREQREARRRARGR